MSSSLIVISIMTGVGLLAIAAYIIQSIENAKAERRRKILSLRDRTRRAWNLVTELPSAYLPADIRKFLLTYIQAKHKEILAIEANNRAIAEQQSQLKELLAQDYTSNPDSAEPIFNDVKTAKPAAGALKSMVNLFVELHKEGLLDKNNAQNYINQGKALFNLINTDIIYLTGKASENDNPKLALAHYSNCRKKLQPFVDQGQLSLRAQFLDQRISLIKAQMKANCPEQPSEIKGNSEDWNELQEGDDWKIKQDYE